MGIHRNTGSYKGLQKVTGGLQGVTRGYRELQGVTEVYKGLQRRFFVARTSLDTISCFILYKNQS